MISFDEFWRVFENLSLAVKTVLPDMSILKGQNSVEKAKIENFKRDNFQTLYLILKTLFFIKKGSWCCSYHTFQESNAGRSEQLNYGGIEQW